MKNKRSLLLIGFISLLSLFVNIPDGVPIVFSLGPIKINRVTSSPQISVPFTSINRKITTNLGLDLQGGTQLVLEADMDKVPQENRITALESAREIIERRVNFFGVGEPIIQSAHIDNHYRIIVELPGIKDVDQAIQTIGQTAQLEFRELDETASDSAYFPMIENTKPTGIAGNDLKSAQVGFDPNTGEAVVNFELTQEGSKKFAETTTRLVGKPLVIFLDNFPLSAPIVQVPITEGNGSITGGFTSDQAKQLALQLSAGALPTPIHIIEQKNVGATLGALSINKSIQAGLIGLSLVAFFMILYYGKLGLIANIALIIYGLITFALFRLIPITLTLPGIAGFILSIGMAVDSNILIFSRMKEEERKGKPWQIAMELGFGRAWDSIRDANTTTILTALILFNPLNWSFLPTSGMVRGFALTLLIGVLTSLFTGIVVTRTLVRTFYKPKKII